jgi:hypothetical protein
MRLKVKLLGMAYRRIEARKGFGDCYKTYKVIKRNMKNIELTEEELVWLGDNGVTHYLPDWHKRTKCLERTELVKEIKLLNKLTSSRMRKELRIRHDDWMRKIQEAADKGKIGRMLKKIIGGSQDFTLEVLYNKDGNTTDCDEIASEVNRMFGQEWFFQTEEERVRGVNIRGMMKSGCGADFEKMSGEWAYQIMYRR